MSGDFTLDDIANGYRGFNDVEIDFGCDMPGFITAKASRLETVWDEREEKYVDRTFTVAAKAYMAEASKIADHLKEMIDEYHRHRNAQ